MTDRGRLYERLRDGYGALTVGRLDAAAIACRDVLTNDPKCVPAHFLLGLICVERKDRKTAVSAFGSVTQLQPAHVAAWAQLARLLLQIGQPGPGEQALARALSIGTTDPIVQDLLGTVLTMWGDRGAADTWFARATAARPDVAQFQIDHANNLTALGRGDAAQTALAAALAADPDNAQAHWMLANVRDAVTTQHIDHMVALRRTHSGRPAALAFVEYALGKEYEDLERWNDAIAAFERGAAAKRATVEYNEAAEAASIDAIIETFTPQWCVRETAGCDDAAPIFVVGEPRTGTTLVERIVSSHSQVHSAGELQQWVPSKTAPWGPRCGPMAQAFGPGRRTQKRFLRPGPAR